MLPDRAERHAACLCLDLADNEVGAVSLCPQCGVVTMRLQYISLRFETEAFERVASLVREARASLDGARRFGNTARDTAEAADSRDEPLAKPH